jgi:3-dehydroquinate dehydratase / shikimate dehydrogenase
MIKYCVSLCCDNISALIEKINEVKSKPDLIELRIDKFNKFDFEQLRQFDIKKMILTFRSKDNGGYYDGSETSRISVLKNLLDFGFGYIDVEYNLHKNDLKWFLANRKTTKIILSYHNYLKTPNNLEKICDKMLSYNPDLIKVISFANKLEDNKKVFDLIDKYKQKTKLIIHNMGEKGEISRILGGLRGNEFTFTSLAEESTAPGQVSIDLLQNIYQLSKLKKNFKIYGLLGNPLKHSHGYLIHNFAYRKSNLNALYLNFLCDNLKNFFNEYQSYFSGLSVTIPFKKEIIPYLDSIDEKAEIIGAVNTIVRKNGKLIGYNTDYIGFIESLKKYINPKNKRVVILGSGGSARAVLVSLLEKNNEITILSRNLENAKKLADEFGCPYGELSEFKEHTPQILVNCTPVGMYPDVKSSPVKLSKLKNCVVYDLIYNPYYTKLLADAVENGNSIVSGFEMFLRQAQEQYGLFTGHHFSYLKHRNYFLKQLRIL